MHVEPQVRPHSWRQAQCLNAKDVEFMIEVKRRTFSPDVSLDMMPALDMMEATE